MSAIEKPAVNNSAQDIALRVSEMAALPQVVYKIIELTGSTLTAAQEIERTISIDPGFTTKILMLANSAYYALPRKMSSVSEAVTFLGFKTVRQMAMTVGIFDVFIGKSDTGSLRRRTWWRHSVDSAVCAQAIALEVGDMAADEAYACGLLHDIGKSLLDRYGEKDYDDVQGLIEAGMDPLRAETKVYGCDHTELGATVATTWGLSDTLAVCIELHHAGGGGEHSRYVAATCLANEIAHAIVAGKSAPTEQDKECECEPEFSVWAVESLDLDINELASIYGRCKDAVTKGASMGAV